MNYNNQNDGSWMTPDYNSSSNRSSQSMNIVTSMSTYMSKVYGWMAGALILSGLAAWFTGHNEAVGSVVFAHPFVFLLIEIGLVVGITAGIERFSAATVSALFVAYSVINGLTLGAIFYVFTYSSIVTTFGVTALTFAVMSLYGYVTKKDLTSIGRLCFFGLIGLIIAGIVNIFLNNGMVSLISSCVGVLVFIGLTAYDTQKIKAYADAAVDEESTTKIALMGALQLYLDFINLFLLLLRFFGNSRD